MLISRRFLNVFILVIFLAGCIPVNATNSPTLSPSQFPRICEGYYAPPNYSPDSNWMAELCYNEDEKSLILTISNKETKILWKLLYRDYIPPMDFVPDGGLSVVLWSNDGRFVYFNSYAATSGGECFRGGTSTESGFGLFRLDLTTGEIIVILPLLNNFGWYGFLFSPTGERLVYGAYARNFNILNIATGQLINIDLITNYSEGGGFLWLSNGLELVYSTVLYNEISEPIGYSLRLVDVQSGNEQIILESPKDCFLAILQTEENILQVEKDFGKVLIEFGLGTNSLISETSPTP